MRVRYLLLVVGLSLALIAAFEGVGEARAPTSPRASNPGMPLTPYPTPILNADPNQSSGVGGGCWLDAKPCDVGLTMTAKIGDTVCATSKGYAHDHTVGYHVFAFLIPPDEVMPGCGYEGAVVTFYVGDQKATQTAIWHAGTSQTMNFTAGHPFARFALNPNLSLDRLSLGCCILNGVYLSGSRMVPFVGDNQCGAAYGLYSPRYVAEVPSAEQQPGCGTEGAEVTFKLLDPQGNVLSVANQTGVWHAWDGVAPPQQLNLTFGLAGGVTMPNTGSGDGPARATAPWGPLALALASLGLTGGVAFLAYRRQRAT